MGEAFDTSGHFHIMPGHPLHRFMRANILTWDDLTPFQQGYVEALFESAWPDLLSQFIAKGMSEPEDHADCVKPEFSDLSPDALAMILADCERFRGRTSSQSRAVGALFWKNRAGGYLSDDGWMPLRVSLSDDGKIHLTNREGGEG